MHPTSRAVSTAVLVVAGIPPTLRWLHGVPTSPPGAATRRASAAALESLLLWGARGAAIVGCWWVLATAVLYLGARLTGRGRLQHRLRPLVLPVLRRAVDGAVAVTLVGGVAHAGEPLPPGLAPPDGPAATAPQVLEAPDDAELRWHVVRRGEHLWSIAESELRVRHGPTAGPPQVAAYWRRVVEANRGSIRSGDPDLIHPGERVRLP